MYRAVNRIFRVGTYFLFFQGSPFPLVAEKIEEELEDYRSKEEDIKRMKSDMGLESGNENDAAIGLLSDNTQVFCCTNLSNLLCAKRFPTKFSLNNVFFWIFLVFSGGN